MKPSHVSADQIPPLGVAWLEELRQKGRSPRTVATYGAALINLVRFMKRGRLRMLHRLRARDLDAWQRSLHTTGCTLSTQEQFTRIISYWFRWLCEGGLIFSNPAAHLNRPKLPKTLPRCPTRNRNETPAP